LAESACAERVSVDLTGGIDSRLLAVVLNYFGLRFEVAASGVPGNSDVQIARAVAEALGKDFHLTTHDAAGSDWNELFVISDGLFDLGKTGRPIQLQKDRVKRGITLALSGAGGELYKDF